MQARKIPNRLQLLKRTLNKWTTTDSTYERYNKLKKQKFGEHLFTKPNWKWSVLSEFHVIRHFKWRFIFGESTSLSCLTLKKKLNLYFSLVKEEISDISIGTVCLCCIFFFFKYWLLFVEHNVDFRLTVTWCTSQMIAHTASEALNCLWIFRFQFSYR